MNECNNDNGGCDDTCTNNDGSYKCSCDDGYELDNDQHMCNGKIVTMHTVGISCVSACLNYILGCL